MTGLPWLRADLRPYDAWTYPAELDTFVRARLQTTFTAGGKRVEWRNADPSLPRVQQERGSNCSEVVIALIWPATSHALDLGGMCLVNEPCETLRLDGLQIDIRSGHLGDISDMLSKLHQRNGLGVRWGELCTWPGERLVLPPAMAEALHAALVAMEPIADARAEAHHKAWLATMGRKDGK